VDRVIDVDFLPQASLTPEIAVAILHTSETGSFRRRRPRSVQARPTLKLLAVATANPDFAMVHVTDRSGRLQGLFERVFVMQCVSFKSNRKKEAAPVIGNVFCHLDITVINN
jgi:hypothetical protein